MTTDTLCLLACQRYAPEMTAVVESEGFDDVDLLLFPACRGTPRLLSDEAFALARDKCMSCSHIETLGGACLPSRSRTPKGLEHGRVHRFEQCFYMFAGQATVDHYLSQGAFLLTSGWLDGWQQVLSDFSFDRAGARELFKEAAERLVLLDTGVAENSAEKLREFAEHVDRPYEILPVGLDHLRLLVTKIVHLWRLEQAAKALAARERQLVATSDALPDMRKQAEEALQEITQKHERMVNCLVGTFLYRHDTNGVFEYVSESVRQLLGYEPEEFLAHFAEFFTSHPKNRKAIEHTELSIKGIKQPSYEIELRTKDGGIRWMVASETPVRDASGRVVAVDGVAHDITELKRTEQELQKAKSFITNIINSMPSMLVSVDPDGIVTQWNSEAERVTGIASAEALGQPLSRVSPRLAAEMDRVNEAIWSRRQLVEAKKAYQHEGETRYEDVTIYPLVEDGVEGAVIRIDDVTDMVRVEEMIAQSEKMLSVGSLAAGVAHEVNNPLAGMIQAASVVSARLTDLSMPANQRAARDAGLTMEGISSFMEARGIIRMLNTIQEAGARAADIVTNMLSFARRSDDSYSPHNPVELLEQAVDLAGSDYDLKKHDFKQIAIVREYEAGLPLIYCEKARLQQVFLNIFKNGAAAMMRGMQEGRKPCFFLRLRHEKGAGRIRIEIEDNGPGMDTMTCKRVFEPFFTTKPVGTGTGLGLSVAYFIVTECLKGEMFVESQLGAGTRFTIRLPLDSTEADERLG